MEPDPKKLGPVNETGPDSSIIKMVPVNEMGPELNVNKKWYWWVKWNRIRILIKMVPINKVKPDPNINKIGTSD